MKDIVLYGAGGLGREVSFLIERINRNEPTYNLIGFIVDEEYYTEGQNVHGYPVVGTPQWIIDHKDSVVCTCAIGEPVVREKVQEMLEPQEVIFETLVSPDVEIHNTVKIGAGSIISRRVSITVDVTIGKGVLINENCGLAHDSVIGDYSCLSGGCGVNGYVQIGKRTRIGGKAYFVPHIKVGDDAVVAAGSIVFTKVKPGTHVLGNPAKRIEL